MRTSLETPYLADSAFEAAPGFINPLSSPVSRSESSLLDKTMTGASPVNQEQDYEVRIKNNAQRAVELVCWSFFIGLVAIDAWSGRQFTQSDGISYLDMSDAFLKHNWHLLINPLWSPLYPFLIGVATWIARPSGHWELPLVHLVNLVILLGAFASFEFLLRQVISVLGIERGHLVEDSLAPSNWRWRLLGYSIFAWSIFVVISIREVSPDLCVAIFVFLDAGLLLRLRSGARRLPTCLLLGLALGLGYFAKAILFPMAFVFMALAFFAIGAWKNAVRPIALTLIIFSAIAAPLFIANSKMVGRPSYSESGNLNYAWHVNGKPSLRFYPSTPPSNLEHPTPSLHSRPTVYDFAQPFITTYPPYYNPEYWNAGIKPTFSPLEQLRAIRSNLAAFLEAPFIPMWILIAGGLLLSFAGSNVPGRFSLLIKSWPIIVPGILATCLFLCVWIEPRYIAPFLVLVLLGLLPIALAGKPQQPSTPSSIAVIAVAAIAMLSTSLFVLHRAAYPALGDFGGAHYKAAEMLNRDGVQPGEAVGLIGDNSDGMILARLARVRIVAQIPPDETSDFWRLTDPREKAGVYDAFQKTGAVAVVTAEILPASGFADWQRVGDSKYYLHFLTAPGRQLIDTPTP